MASRNVKLISVALVAAAAAGGWFLYNALAAQAQGALAQAPLNNQVQVPPAFIMAVDDSGSMTFQHQFPIADGYACWDQTTASFFSSPGVVSTSGTSCRYAYSYTSIRNGWTYHGIPPLDVFGFSRSSDFNPAYFDPTVNYLPWMESDGEEYPQASLTATRIHPEYNASVSLASNLERADADTEFFAYRGMTLPAGTRFRRAATCTNAGDTFPTNNNWTTLIADYTVPNNAYTSNNTQYQRGCRIYVQHWPATFFLRYSGDTDEYPQLDGASIYSGLTRVRVDNACGSGCHLWKYTITATDTAALQNFANWFSFYGNRQRAMIAGMTRSLATVTNMRVGYFTINSGHDGSGSDQSDYDEYDDVTMYDMGVAADRQSLYADMVSLDASGSTPNLPATNHLGAQFQRTDSGAPVQLACQRNAGMLFTDGFSNVNFSTPAIAGLGAPFDPTPVNSLAAIASKYYFDDADGASPLRTDLDAGAVPVSGLCSSLDPDSMEWKRLDCQTNLHMNFYGVTLGGRGARFNPDLDQDPYTDYAGWSNPKWPGYNSGNRNTVDDIWHATVNTRGEFISARTPADITDAMRRILAAVVGGASPSGTLALTGSRISTRSLTVQPSYEIRNEGTNWFSQLAASTLSLDPVTRVVTETQIWEASDRLAATTPATRRNHTWYGHASGASLFNSANITSLDTLCNNPRPSMSRCEPIGTGDPATLGIGVAEAIDYLLGDTSREVRNGGTLRDRFNEQAGQVTLLGDIINSTPVVSAPTDDYGYRSLPSPYGSSYGTYMDTTKRDRAAMVYVGANDGMLHAFHGGIDRDGNVDTANGGREQFAYIPRAVLGHMGNLLFPYVPDEGGDQIFDHRYFVDGPVSVSDAYFGGANPWRTVLVATAGAGGRSVFGLDVSNPSSFTSSNRLWEIDDQHSTLAVRQNIGHVLGRPVIVPVKTGPAPGTVAWKAIFGNGYNSNSGKAVLFVVDMQSGAVQMTEAIEPGAPSTGTNGLGNIVVVDRWGGNDMSLNIRDGYADTVYGADQKGAIWKFDLRNVVASIDTPIFTTQEHTESGETYRQPIIGGLTATAGRGNGVMLLFGTGSFSFVHDAKDESIQTIYGVLDVNAPGTLDSSDLFQRTIVTSDTETRTISTAGMPFGYSGWYLNLPAGERSVGYPRVASGVLFVPTYAPTVADGCSTQGMNWLYGLNTRTGGPALESVRFGSTSGDTQGEGVGAVALDTQGTAPVKDVGLTILSRAAPPNPGVAGPPDDGCWMRITVPGMAQAMFVPYPCGRQSWRQIQ